MIYVWASLSQHAIVQDTEAVLHRHDLPKENVDAHFLLQIGLGCFTCKRQRQPTVSATSSAGLQEKIYDGATSSAPLLRRQSGAMGVGLTLTRIGPMSGGS